MSLADTCLRDRVALHYLVQLFYGVSWFFSLSTEHRQFDASFTKSISFGVNHAFSYTQLFGHVIICHAFHPRLDKLLVVYAFHISSVELCSQEEHRYLMMGYI